MANLTDLNLLMSRIDWNRVLSQGEDQAPLHSSVGIVSQATAGFTTDILDAIRCIGIDRDLNMASWMRYLRGASRMPPTPYDSKEEQQRVRNPGNDDPQLPTGPMHKAVAVQECYSGFPSQAMSFALDTIFLLVAFLLVHMVYGYARKLCLGGTLNAFAAWVSLPGENLLWASMGYGMFWFWYYLLSTWLIGKTFGMHVFGLEIVIDRRSDKRAGFPFDEGISFWRALFRTVALPFCPMFLIFTLWRRDGRMFQDLLAGTGVVYSWDADAALYRQQGKISKRMAKMKYKKGGLLAPLLDSDSMP